MDGRPYFISVEEARAITYQTPPHSTLKKFPSNCPPTASLHGTLTSKVNDPPDNSAMDGFACRHDANALPENDGHRWYPSRLRGQRKHEAVTAKRFVS